MKKLSKILSVLLIFTIISGSYGFAAREDLTQEEMALQLDEVVKDLYQTIDGFLDTSYDEMDLSIKTDENIKNSELIAEEYAKEMGSSPSIFKRIYDKYIKITTTIERQYHLKKTFLDNANTSNILVKQIKNDVESIYSELSYIFNNPDANLPVEDFYFILVQLKQLNLELKNNDYITGSLAKTSVRYIKEVAKFNILEASELFEEIVDLQFSQIQLLEASNNYLQSINNRLVSL